MRLHLQRVSRAHVDVDGDRVASIGPGLLVLAGFGHADEPGLPESALWDAMLKKILNMRIFPDESGKLNESVLQQGGEMLVVSQFTLYADCRKGRRPSFHPAAQPDVAERLYDVLVDDLARRMPGRVQSGRFGADMDVGLINWGPVTIMLDSADFRA